ncbi:M23 family metallopeptidase [Thermus scotoductus]|uniref:M23 family metallopeptidase n=1 Tax=Thermus scotoductus TaxID=37636 RepID=UPI001C12BCF5
MRILRSLAQDRGLPYVAALEVRQATPELFPLLDALTCARLGISVGTFPQEASHLERPRNEALALPSREEALDRIPFPEAWAAARDLGRALGLPAELRRRLTKTLGRDFRHLSPHRAREAEPLFREVLGEAPVKELLLRLLSLMEKGHVRHLMPHVGGVVVAPGPLTRYAPVVRSAGGVRMLTLDKDDLEALGLVKLDHAEGYQSLYGHLSRLAVRPGQRVEKGQVLGYVGSTGRSTGPHLHYGVYRYGSPLDPRPYLDPLWASR